MRSLAFVGERRGIAAVARRQHAVEHIDAGADAGEEVLRPADAHQIARFLDRQQRRRRAEGGDHLRRRLADAEAAQGVAGKVQRGQLAAQRAAQLQIGAALHDGEQRLIRSPLSRSAALGPANRSVDSDAQVIRAACRAADIRPDTWRCRNRGSPEWRRRVPASVPRGCRRCASEKRRRDRRSSRVCARL